MADDEKEKKENPFGSPSIELSSYIGYKIGDVQHGGFTYSDFELPKKKPEPSPQKSTKSDNDK